MRAFTFAKPTSGWRSIVPSAIFVKSKISRSAGDSVVFQLLLCSQANPAAAVFLPVVSVYDHCCCLFFIPLFLPFCRAAASRFLKIAFFYQAVVLAVSSSPGRSLFQQPLLLSTSFFAFAFSQPLLPASSVAASHQSPAFRQVCVAASLLPFPASLWL